MPPEGCHSLVVKPLACQCNPRLFKETAACSWRGVRWSRDGNRSGRPAGMVEILRPAGQAG